MKTLLDVDVRHHEDGAEITVTLPNGNRVTIGLDWYGDKKQMFQVIADGTDEIKAIVQYDDDAEPCSVLTQLDTFNPMDDQICPWLVERDGEE